MTEHNNAVSHKQFISPVVQFIYLVTVWSTIITYSYLTP